MDAPLNAVSVVALLLALAIVFPPQPLNGLGNQPSVAVTSAANYEPAVAPDSLAALFGTDLAQGTVQAQLDAAGNLPTELRGLSVEIKDRKAGLIFVSPRQVNFWGGPRAGAAGHSRKSPLRRG